MRPNHPARRGRAANNQSFVDESIKTGQGQYMVCAAVAAAHELSKIRAALRAERAPGARSVHMAKERPERRKRVLDVAGGLDISAQLYVAALRGRPHRTVRSECLAAMVPDLAGAGVSHLYLESCDQDDQDMRVLVQARNRIGMNADTLHIDHRRPYEEPMLWLPDAIAWAWTRGGDYRARISGLVVNVVDVAA